jgi:DNA-binding MarR family transcriptional regulator
VRCQGLCVVPTLEQFVLHSDAGMAMTRRRQEPRQKNLTDMLACANHLMVERLHGRAKRQGLSVTECRVLGALAQFDGIRMIRLAALTLSKPVTLTKTVNHLERAQLVRRRTPSDDRRGTLVYLTEDGRRLATLLSAQARADDQAMTGVLEPATSDKVKGALVQLIGLFEAPGWPAAFSLPPPKRPA